MCVKRKGLTKKGIGMSRLTGEVRRQSMRTTMFAEDVFICSKNREEVEEHLERLRFFILK